MNLLHIKTNSEFTFKTYGKLVLNINSLFNYLILFKQTSRGNIPKVKYPEYFVNSMSEFVSRFIKINTKSGHFLIQTRE
jgi:hypothetical protein